MATKETTSTICLFNVTPVLWSRATIHDRDAAGKHQLETTSIHLLLFRVFSQLYLPPHWTDLASSPAF